MELISSIPLAKYISADSPFRIDPNALRSAQEIGGVDGKDYCFLEWANRVFAGRYGLICRSP